jgi:hypothetical protein
MRRAATLVAEGRTLDAALKTSSDSVHTRLRVIRATTDDRSAYEVHHAIRDAVHRTGDLDRSFLLQIRQYRASPPNVFDCQFDIGSGNSVDVSRILAGLLAFKLGFRNGRFDPRQQSREIA